MPLTVNNDEYKSVVGLDSLYIAEVTADSSSAYTADTPEYLAPAAEASQEPTTNSVVQYADDLPYDSMTAEGETVITLTLTALPLAMLAKLLGKEYDSTTGRMYDNAGSPPFFALSFRSMKSNGSYRYYQYLKGKFEMPAESQATKSDTPDPKTIQLKYTAIFTTYVFDLGDVNDRVKRVIGDSDATNFSATSFFSQVQTPAVTAPSALALSTSTPADAATGVSVSANLTLTFNNALDANALYNVFIAKGTDGTLVTMASGYPSIDATRKIITFDPASSLTASTAHIIAYAVVDIYGQHLTGIVNFTTA